MRNPIDVLKNLTEKSKNKEYKFQRLYRNLYNPEFYYLAYKNIYANKGSMTAGTDETTMDGISDSRIEKIIASLKDHSYKPNPARREYIAKKNSNKKRPLGISSGNDKLVQEVVRMILESIFEPNFLNTSHGFRPKRSCHTALKHIQINFKGARWFIEGDIEACFDSFDHHVIIELLRKRISDEAFISLIWKFLKAGYMEQWQYHRTYSGVPQGSGVSPILANIYLNELDEYMENYKASFNVGKSSTKTVSSKYNSLRHKVMKCKKENTLIWESLNESERKERTKNLKSLQQELYKTPTQDIWRTSFKSLRYCRYADDFIIGIIGSKEDATKVKADIKHFLSKRLKLKMSDEKTKVTHTGDRARFLGYDITVSRDKSVKKASNNVKRRTYSYNVKLLVPREKWMAKLKEYDAFKIVKGKDGKERFKAIHRSKLINCSDIEILSKYNAEVRGLYNFYSFANNAYAIGRFANIMQYSMLKTFAGKYKTTVSKIKARFVKDNNFTVEYQTKSGTKQSVFYNKGFKRNKDIPTYEVSLLPQYARYDKVNKLSSRIKLGLCELCNQKTDNIELHQVAKLKDLKGTNKWERIMIDRRRKTLAVCPKCHEEIHS